MKVVVACDAVGETRAVHAGRVLAQAWRDAGAQVALVPMGATGSDLVTALRDAGAATGTDPFPTARTPDALVVVPPRVEQPAWTGTSESAGTALEAALADPRALVAVDLTTVPAHDGGAGLLSALGATADTALTGGWGALDGITALDLEAPRARLAGCELVGLVDIDDTATPLTSLRGVSSVRGRAEGLDLSEIVAADTALGALAALAGVDGVLPGPGAAGGNGLAVLALGGTLTTAPALSAGLAHLDRSLARADLLVSACTSLDIGNYGGPVVRHLAGLAVAHGVPLVVGAGHLAMGGRELRAHGVEAGYALDATTARSLRSSAAGMVRTWTW
ncbi:glycerate kinase [Propionicicella superfundia]|uniref:glycerate kinase n=1 Tax=Propionicicella superfundia TaxID=348582 RepID=UPI00146DE77B|nr:glycerate kinase [Propionicicella superfundia]